MVLLRCSEEASTLEIVPYDSRWPLAFQAERDRMTAALGGLVRRVDHHGSTAVPGLAAKPIIDMQISVGRLHPIDAYAPALARLGYEHAPHPDDACCPFFHRPHAWPHTHHVHVVQLGGAEERRTLAFRDYLRECRDVAGEYEALKRELAARHDASLPASREAYAASKTEFVERVVQMALAAGHPRELFELTIARTRMRPLTLDDVDVMHALWIDPDVRKHLWDDLIIGRERAAEVVAASCRDFAKHGYGLWAICLKESEEPVGFCGLRQSEHGGPELLFGLWPRWWRQGLAAEASRAVLTYAFCVLGHAIVEGATDLPNQASIRVMERLGMRFMRRGLLNGLDTVFYELTREAFEAWR